MYTLHDIVQLSINFLFLDSEGEVRMQSKAEMGTDHTLTDPAWLKVMVGPQGQSL